MFLFCLILPKLLLVFYVSGRLVVFSSLRAVVFCRRHPIVPLIAQAVCYGGSRRAGPSVVLSKLCGLSGRLGWLLVRLVAKPCPVQRVLAPGW